MKAIILAGGEGTRLRPLTAKRAKPMIELLGSPVLEHTVRLLKKSGITDICMTLGYLPETVSGYFGDGRDFGVSIKYNIEREPLGTAGGVAACRDFIGDDDFIVISGDAVCDFDLEEAMAYHRQKRADVTIVVSECDEPLEFGVVVSKADGRIEGFIEKPDWENVRSNMINTGIYILSGKVLDSVPKDVIYDFSRDLFPRLMVEKKGLYAFAANGYWRDIGNCDSFLQCVYDALDGKVNLDKKVPQLVPGVWSGTDLGGMEINITPPVYIASGVKIERGAKIGPYTVIGEKSIVKSKAVVTNSVVLRSSVGKNARLDGCVVCPDVAVGDDARIDEGAVIGDGTKIGDAAHVLSGVKIWHGRRIEPGSRVAENIIKGSLRRGLEFSGGGEITEELNVSITAGDCIALGSAAASLGSVAVGWDGQNGARTLADAFGSGVRSAGVNLTTLGECFAAASAYMGRALGAPVTAFFAQDGSQIKISFFDSRGEAIGRDTQRKIEQTMAGGYERAPAVAVGGVERLAGVMRLYSSAAARDAAVCSDCEGVTAVIDGDGSAAATLAAALKMIGVSAEGHAESAPHFTVSPDGFSLTAKDENGRQLPAEMMLVLTAMTEFDRGETVINVGKYAPAVLSELADRYGGQVGRGGEEGDVMRHAVFSAVRICSAMAAKHEPLSDMVDRAPEFAVSSREVALDHDRGRVMKSLHYSELETVGDEMEGFTAYAAGGFVRITPNPRRRSLIIRSEAKSIEVADELCADFEKLIKNADAE